MKVLMKMPEGLQSAFVLIQQAGRDAKDLPEAHRLLLAGAFMELLGLRERNVLDRFITDETHEVEVMPDGRVLVKEK